MDKWEKCNEALPEKDDFYSNLNMENIKDADYMHAKRVFNDFQVKTWVNIMICILKVAHYYR